MDTKEIREKYRKGEFPRANVVQDPNVRYRWDLFYTVKAYNAFGGHDKDYKHDHIDTALRSIVPPLRI